MLGRGPADADDELAIGLADAETTAGSEQVSPCPLLQLVPESEGAPRERHVSRVLVVGGADDARGAVRGAAVVTDGELFQPEDAPPAPGQFRRRRCSHAANT